MSLCKDCVHSGLCVVKQKLEESTMMEFPDGKTALLEMEQALVACDHHTPVGQQVLSEPFEDVMEDSESEFEDTEKVQWSHQPSVTDPPRMLNVQEHVPETDPETWTYGPDGSVSHSRGNAAVSTAPVSVPEQRRPIRLNLGGIGRR